MEQRVTIKAGWGLTCGNFFNIFEDVLHVSAQTVMAPFPAVL